jgi:hypothetical protein
MAGSWKVIGILDVCSRGVRVGHDAAAAIIVPRL